MGVEITGNLKAYIELAKDELKTLYANISRNGNFYKDTFRDHERLLRDIHNEEGKPFYAPTHISQKNLQEQIQKAIEVLAKTSIHDLSLAKKYITNLGNALSKRGNEKEIKEEILKHLSSDFLKETYLDLFMKKNFLTFSSNPRIASLWNAKPKDINQDILEKLKKSFDCGTAKDICGKIEEAQQLFPQKENTIKWKEHFITLTEKISIEENLPEEEDGTLSKEQAIESIEKYNPKLTVVELYLKQLKKDLEKIKIPFYFNFEREILSPYKEKKTTSEIAEIFSRFLDYFIKIAEIDK